jgi:hypothetical protein
MDNAKRPNRLASVLFEIGPLPAGVAVFIVAVETLVPSRSG